MILFGINYHNYRIELSRHASIRARQRNISTDLIYWTIKTGKITRFGKNHLKFIKRYKKFIIKCVGGVIGDKILIVTVTKNERRRMYTLWR